MSINSLALIPDGLFCFVEFQAKLFVDKSVVKNFPISSGYRQGEIHMRNSQSTDCHNNNDYNNNTTTNNNNNHDDDDGHHNESASGMHHCLMASSTVVASCR